MTLKERQDLATDRATSLPDIPEDSNCVWLVQYITQKVFNNRESAIKFVEGLDEGHIILSVVPHEVLD